MKHQIMDVDQFNSSLGKATPHKAQPALKLPPLPPRVGAQPGPVTLELPMPPKVLRPNARASWQARLKAKKKARQECGLLARINRPRVPFKRATLHATFYIRNRADDDNLISWLKYYLDGLQDGGVIENDRGLTILAPSQVIDRKNQRVVLRIEEIQ